jgi:hypothetical protein
MMVATGKVNASMQATPRVAFKLIGFSLGYWISLATVDLK